VNGETVLLSKMDEKYYAVSAACTHYGAPLAEGLVEGQTVRCPWHHACFSLKTGTALKAPAFDNLQRWLVETADGEIFVRTKMGSATPPRPAIANHVRKVVIVGGGAAGFAAAEMLRRQGFKGQITMLSDDYEPP
jgi:nitrite reductase/ring-hydroxylating ferredoxin subunit